MAAEVLVAKGLTKHYGAGPTLVRALDEVDFDLQAGEILALLGPSGSGKSTLLNLIGGLDTRSQKPVATSFSSAHSRSATAGARR